MHECDLCGRKFYTERGLKQHQARATNHSRKPAIDYGARFEEFLDALLDLRDLSRETQDGIELKEINSRFNNSSYFYTIVRQFVLSGAILKTRKGKKVFYKVPE